jgi:hypothetical protein
VGVDKIEWRIFPAFGSGSHDGDISVEDSIFDEKGNFNLKIAANIGVSMICMIR